MNNESGRQGSGSITDWACDRTIEVAGIPFVSTSMSESVRVIAETALASRGQIGASIRLANAYCVALAKEDAGYGDLLSKSGINFPDGSPVAAFMKVNSRENADLAPERVRGPSFFRDLLSSGRDIGLRHMFVGADEETLRLLVQNAEALFPGVLIVESWSPPFGPLDEQFYDQARKRIKDSSPDIVWVGMGTPKQDFASTRIAQENNIFAIGVGAAFNFVAGTVNEAPKIVQTLCLEWLYRLICEPKRLWRRYVFGNVTFLKAAVRGTLSSSVQKTRGNM